MATGFRSIRLGYRATLKGYWHAQQVRTSPANSENDSPETDSPDTVLIPWIDVAQPRMLTDVTNVVSSANLEKDATENESLKEASTGSNTEADGYDRTKEVVVANPPEKADAHGSRSESLVQSGL